MSDIELASTDDANDDANHSARIEGEPYIGFLGRLHDLLRPRSYFEIGTLHGDTLSLAKCASIAVDPQFKINQNIVGPKPFCLLFGKTSDRFFDDHNPTELLGHRIELAFLDGMHLFEFLLRDFINTEKYCRKNSVILLHDCLPPGFYMTTRRLSDPILKKSRFGPWWTGDVWKIVPVLRKYRPDLALTLFDCPPTGLVAISNLDPSNDILSSKYNEIINQHSNATIDRASYDSYWKSLTIESSKKYPDLESLATKFWL